jgi:Glycosyl transferases group 1
MKNKKIVICASPHTFGAIQIPAEMMAQGLRENGIDAVVFLIDKKTGAKEFVNYIKENRVEAVIALNPSVLRLRYRLRRLLSYINTRLCVFLLDAPPYHFKALNSVITSSVKGAYILLPDADQKSHMDVYIDNINVKNVEALFFPWAGPEPQCVSDETSRVFDCAVFCTLDQQITQGVTKQALIEEIEAKYPSIYGVKDIVNSMFEQSYGTSISDLYYKVTGSKFNFNSTDALDLWMRLDSLLKEHRRLAMALELVNLAKNEKLKMIICGTGWEKLLPLPDGIMLAGAVHYSKQFDVFKQSRFVVNLDPNWTNGVHDRVFNAMSVGAAVITNKNQFVIDAFVEGENILTFENIHDLPSLIRRADSAVIANHALAPYIKSHTWRHRMKGLVTAMNLGETSKLSV